MIKICLFNIKKFLFKHIITAVLGIFFILLTSCKSDVIPKPNGFPRLEYKNAIYIPYSSNCPYIFEYSNQTIIKLKKDSCWIDIKYPSMKAAIYLTYYPINGNLKNQIKQTEKMVYDHTIKAASIKPKFYLNKKNNTFGTLYKLNGESATNFQFYITDSITHFVAGSVYFRTQPKPDSLKPAIEYLEKDVTHLMETFKWK